MPSKLTSSDIYEIVNQASVRSRPLRVNFAALVAKLNEVIDAVAAAAIGTTNAETTNARPQHASLLDRLDSMWKGQANYKKYGGAVTVNSNSAKCDVSAGEAKVDGADVKWTSQTSAALTACTAGNHRIDIVVANSAGTITIITGSESADAGTSPQVPDYASTQLPLAYLYIDDSSPVVLTGNIHTNYALQGGSLTFLFMPNDVKYVTLNDTTADFTFDTTWMTDISLVGSMTLIVTHHSSDCTLTFTDTMYHINVDGAVSDQEYVLPSGATKRTIFQIYYDGTSLFVMENPFYVVV